MNKKQILDLLAMQASLIQTALLAHMKGEHFSESDIAQCCAHGYRFLVETEGHEFDPVMGTTIFRHVQNVNDQLTKNPVEYEKEIQKEYEEKIERNSEKEIVRDAVGELCRIFGIDPNQLPN